MNKKIVIACTVVSALAYIVCAVAVFLFHPAVMYFLNTGSNTFQHVAGVVFWCGLGIGLLGGIVASVWRSKKAPKFKTWQKSQWEKKGVGRVRSTWVRTPLSIVFLVCFVVGLAGSIISMVIDTASSYHTFAFLAITVFGLCEYVVFNSINYMYMKEELRK